MRPCVRFETMLTQHLKVSLADYLTHFHQTYTNDVLWDRDECVKFWGQKVTVQGHSGMELSLHRRRHTVLDVSCRARLSSYFTVVI